MDKLYNARMQGMYYALKQIEDNGVEDFKNELLFRQRFGVKILTPHKELKEYGDTIINNSMRVILIFAVAVLHDEFGFGEKRCRQFIERFNLKTACLAENYLTWDEQVKVLEDELNIHIGFR